MANAADLDAGWITFGLRRAMARQGLLLVDDRKEAQVIVEAALGAYGTDEVDHRLRLPSAVPLGVTTVSIGDSTSAFCRKNRQDAVVKLALIGFDATTRQLIWESGTIIESQPLDRVFLGSRNISRRTTLPELQSYPPRRLW